MVLHRTAEEGRPVGDDDTPVVDAARRLAVDCCRRNEATFVYIKAVAVKLLVHFGLGQGPVIRNCKNSAPPFNYDT